MRDSVLICFRFRLNPSLLLLLLLGWFVEVDDFGLEDPQTAFDFSFLLLSASQFSDAIPGYLSAGSVVIFRSSLTQGALPTGVWFAFQTHIFVDLQKRTSLGQDEGGQLLCSCTFAHFYFPALAEVEVERHDLHCHLNLKSTTLHKTSQKHTKTNYSRGDEWRQLSYSKCHMNIE